MFGLKTSNFPLAIKWFNTRSANFIILTLLAWPKYTSKKNAKHTWPAFTAQICTKKWLSAVSQDRATPFRFWNIKNFMFYFWPLHRRRQFVFCVKTLLVVPYPIPRAFFSIWKCVSCENLFWTSFQLVSSKIERSQ